MNNASPSSATSRTGMILLWLHTVLFVILALMGYIAPDLLFGSAVMLQTPAVATKWLSGALVVLALFLVTSIRKDSAVGVRTALFGALLFDVQAAITLGSFPASLQYFEMKTGLPFDVFPQSLALLVGITVFELSRMGRKSAARTRTEAVTGEEGQPGDAVA